MTTQVRAPQAVAAHSALEERIKDRLCLPERIRHTFDAFVQEIGPLIPTMLEDCQILQERIRQNPLQTAGQKMYAAISLAWLNAEHVQSPERGKQLQMLMRVLLPSGVNVAQFEKDMAEIRTDVLYAQETERVVEEFLQAAGQILEKTADAQMDALRSQEESLFKTRDLARFFLERVAQEIHACRDASKNRVQEAKGRLLEKLQSANTKAQEWDAREKTTSTLLQKLLEDMK
jgi:hypothetical protein